MSVKKFKTIFDGLQLAYGVFKIEKTAANGKSTGRAAVIREPRITKLGKTTLLVRAGMELFQLTSRISVSGGVLTINTLWTTNC